MKKQVFLEQFRGRSTEGLFRSRVTRPEWHAEPCHGGRKALYAILRALDVMKSRRKDSGSDVPQSDLTGNDAHLSAKVEQFGGSGNIPGER